MQEKHHELLRLIPFLGTAGPGPTGPVHLAPAGLGPRLRPLRQPAEPSAQALAFPSAIKAAAAAISAAAGRAPPDVAAAGPASGS